MAESVSEVHEPDLPEDSTAQAEREIPQAAAEAPESLEDSMPGLRSPMPVEQERETEDEPELESLDTLAQSLDLPEPVDGLPGLEAGAEEHFRTISEEPSGSIDDVLMEEPPVEEPGSREAAAPPAIEATPEIELEEPAISAVRGLSEAADEEPVPPQVEEERELQPLAEAPPVEQPPPSAPALVAEAPQPRPADPSSWGANQEHFLGGLPLRTGRSLGSCGAGAADLASDSSNTSACGKPADGTAVRDLRSGAATGSGASRAADSSASSAS